MRNWQKTDKLVKKAKIAFDALELSVTTQADRQRLATIAVALRALDADRARVLDRLEQLLEEEATPEEPAAPEEPKAGVKP